MRQRLYKFCAGLLVALELSFLFATSGTAQKREPFDPDGSFWIHGTPPKDFENFSGINLNSKGRRRLAVSGVDLTDGTRLRFKTLTVARDKLLFTTVVVKGYSYSFTGHFLRGGVFSESALDQETPFLEGTLSKWHRRVRVARGKLTFTYFGGT